MPRMFSSLHHCSALHFVHSISSSQLAWITSKNSSLLCSACFCHVDSFVDHHGNSSSSLAVMFPMSSSSLVVIMRLPSFSGSQDSSSSLSITASQLWLLRLLSPFLHVTISGDQVLIQQGASRFLSSERWLHFTI
jgi:hypothetical protein